eukprot:tig00021276_g19899.t1
MEASAHRRKLELDLSADVYARLVKFAERRGCASLEAAASLLALIASATLAPPEHAAAAAVEVSPFDRLPDVVLSVICEHLGLKAAAGARGVSRRWRDAAGAVLWRRLDPGIELGSERADLLARLLVGAECMEGDRDRSGHRRQRPPRRWIRLAPGASLRLDLGERVDVGSWKSAVALVSACAAASGGLGDLELLKRFVCAHDSSSPACLRDLLGVLLPTRLALRGVALRVESAVGRSKRLRSIDVEEAFRPFPNLESLCLPRCCVVDQPAADALSRCLPRLKRLELRLQCGWAEEQDFEQTTDDSYETAAALAALPALERLVVQRGYDECGSWDLAPMIAGLASGPAARSVEDSPAPPCTPFRASSHSSACGDPSRYLFLIVIIYLFEPSSTIPNFLALQLGRLTTLGPLRLCPRDSWPRDGDEEEEEAECLAIAGCLSGLAEALAKSHTLADLELTLPADLPAVALTAFAALVREAKGRLFLEIDIDLELENPVEPELAVALASAPPSRLVLMADVDWAALDGGKLDCLSAFAGCSTGDVEVRLDVEREMRDRLEALEAARGAATRAFPSARLVIEYRRRCE